MKPHYADDWLTVYHGDARTVMASMEPESVHCVVTSPPYWGLRDYREDGQLGLEPTPEAYVESMVAVFREVRRVLRSDGTVWLNLGDSYAGGGNGGGGSFAKDGIRTPLTGTDKNQRPAWKLGGSQVPFGLKPKDLVGIPWRVAFALQADGWYLRSDIIWSKPNPMPESVTDRPTKSHEYLFLLSKSPRYYFDNEAIREPEKPWNGGRINAPKLGPERIHGAGAAGTTTKTFDVIKGANVRTVWTIATAPYPGAHFATFPPKLIEPCIKAGTSERGVCPECGAPWERIVERELAARTNGGGSPAHSDLKGYSPSSVMRTNELPIITTIDWQSSCKHNWEPVPATVLDPFAGSGTTGMVAQSLSRRAVLIDLSMDYLGQLMDRNRDIPLGLGA